MKVLDKQFFQDSDSRLSMSRLLLFGSFVTSSAIMGYVTYAGDMAQGYLTIYLGAFTGSYLGGKGIDKMKNGNLPIKGKK